MGFSDNLLLFLFFVLIRHYSTLYQQQAGFLYSCRGYINFSLIFALQMFVQFICTRNYPHEQS